MSLTRFLPSCHYRLGIAQGVKDELLQPPLTLVAGKVWGTKVGVVGGELEEIFMKPLDRAERLAR